MTSTIQAFLDLPILIAKDLLIKINVFSKHLHVKIFLFVSRPIGLDQQKINFSYQYKNGIQSIIPPNCINILDKS